MPDPSPLAQARPLEARAPDPSSPPLLAALRLASLRCRIAPQLAPSAACRLLLPDARAGEFAEALARALPGLMRRRPQILPPESRARSFDEAWLLALAEARRRGDAASVRFLVGRRVRPGGAAALDVLLGGLTKRLDNS